MMVQADLGAKLSTMFMVRYQQGGFADAHEPPAETYENLDGEVEATFDRAVHRLRVGDAAAGVGRRRRPRDHHLATPIAAPATGDNPMTSWPLR